MLLSAASLPPDELAMQSGFTRWDIETYIRLILGAVVQGLTELDMLTDLAGTSLSWAVAACQFIRSEPGGTLAERLSKVLLHCDGNDSSASELYACIFQHKLERLDLGAFYTRRNGLTSLVQAAPSSWSQSAVPHRVIACQCFKVMAEMLRFNICGIKTSYVSNNDIEGLQLRIHDHIPPHLLYACANWAFHASFALSHPVLVSAALSFLRRHTLEWLEVMSLTKLDVHGSLKQLYVSEVSLQTDTCRAFPFSYLQRSYRKKRMPTFKAASTSYVIL